jgi:predicted nucleic acid-binding protein
MDSSALVKLVGVEPESGRLVDHLADPSDHAVCSALGAVEVSRAVARAGLGDQGSARVEAVLSAIDLRQIDADIIAAASRLEPAELRSLDAIHLVTALELAGDLDELVAYDARLLEAAERHGITTVSP